MWDVIVVGGGPAGATVASLLLKYRPGTRVLLLEREPFPRFHIGESLVAEINRVLEEMDLYEAVHDAGFVRKYGATFVWGQDREPWDLVFGELPPLKRFGSVQTSYTWHVERSVYDKILLDKATEQGAELRHDSVTALLEEDGRVVGVIAGGEELRARFVVDATGQSGLAGSERDRTVDPFLRNISYWGYFRGVGHNAAWNGPQGRSHAFLVAHPHGWSWCFPIRPDVWSIGVVTRLEGHQAASSPEAYLMDALASSTELAEIMKSSELITLEEGGDRVHVLKDFSYSANQIVRPGFVRVGDAAGFVDPILSVGCLLGQSFGRFLAYGLNTLLDDDPGLTEEQVFTGYQHQVMDTVMAYREVTYFFYRFNERKDAWWTRARELLASTASWAEDDAALLCFATGFAAQRSVYREPTAAFDEGFFVSAYQAFVSQHADIKIEPHDLAPTDVVRLVGEPLLVESAVPVDGEGVLGSSLRVGIAVDGVESNLARRIQVPPSMRPLFALIDGQRSVSELGDELADALGVPPEHRKAVQRYTQSVLSALVERGLAHNV